MADASTWIGCVNEPNSFLRWFECHPSAATILTGLLAVLSAIGGVWAIYRQIRSQRQIEEEKRKRSFQANRATLPPTVDILASYAMRCGEIVQEIYRRGFGGSAAYAADLAELPPLDRNTVDQLRDLVEFGPSEIHDAVSAMLKELQLLTARLKHVLADHRGGSIQPSASALADEAVINAAALLGWTALFFEFARERCDTLPIRLDETSMHNALNVLGFRPSAGQRLHDMISRRHQDQSAAAG